MTTTTRIQEQLKQDAQRAQAADIPFNPTLPPCFDPMPHQRRPAGHRRWWGRPYIVASTCDESDPFYEKWLAAWPSGIRYDVRCLDGGAWDRSTCWGMFGTLDEAMGMIRGDDMKPILERLQELEAHLADAVALMNTIPRTFTAEERLALQGLTRVASIAAWNEAQVTAAAGSNAAVGPREDGGPKS